MAEAPSTSGLQQPSMIVEVRKCMEISGTGGVCAHDDQEGEVSNPCLRWKPRGPAVRRGTNIPLSSINFIPLSLTNDLIQQQEVTQQTWHWTPVVFHDAQPTFADSPPPVKTNSDESGNRYESKKEHAAVLAQQCPNHPTVRVRSMAYHLPQCILQGTPVAGRGGGICFGAAQSYTWTMTKRAIAGPLCAFLCRSSLPSDPSA